jgi:hypothetical protein
MRNTLVRFRKKKWKSETGQESPNDILQDFPLGKALYNTV